VDSEQALDFNGVFCVAPDGKLTAEWMGAKSTRPNGLVLSPDARTLHITAREALLHGLTRPPRALLARGRGNYKPHL